MPVTNYPQGLSSYGFNLIGSGHYLGAGNVFWVSSLTGTDAAGRGLDPSRPFKTINFALSKCFFPGQASTGSGALRIGGDYIFALPGHVESISAAGSTASPGPVGSLSVNVAGVSIIGLGNGAQRPTIQWTNAAGQLLLNAANTRIENFVFDLATQVNAVTAAITCNAANCQINSSTFIQSTNAANAALIGISLTAGWSHFSMANTVVRPDTALPHSGATSFLAVAAGDDLSLTDNFWNLDASNSVIDGGTAIITNVNMVRGTYQNVNAARLIIKGNNSSTGVIRDIYTFVNGGAVGGVVSGTGWAWLQCWGKGVAAANASGALVPGAASY